MRLKTFYAKTMTEAMQMVRDALGENAIIVATREEQGGRRVRVTAAIDEADSYGPPGKVHFEFGQNLRQAASKPINRDDDATPAAAVPQNWLAYDEEEEDGGVAEILSEILLRHNASNEVMDTIVTAAMLVGGEDPRRVLTHSLGNLFTFAPDMGADRPLMLVGSPGVGKTLATAKLAARAALAGQETAVITTDTVRAGGLEQLSAFTRILNIKLRGAKSPREMVDHIAEAREGGARRIIIDTGGTNPFDPMEMKDLAKYLQAAPVDAAFVMPGGLDADESGEMARVYAMLGVSGLLPTRLDIARRLGGVLAAAHKGGMSFALATHTSGVADGVMALTPSSLAGLLMPKNKNEITTGGKQ
jgi:flagellar biosynthesis protein FlhF